MPEDDPSSAGDKASRKHRPTVGDQPHTSGQPSIGDQPSLGGEPSFGGEPTVEVRPPLTDAARRALAEAAERRKKAEAVQKAEHPAEEGGREGPEPVRYGDWEVKGIATDF